jgi:hypothetical protein
MQLTIFYILHSQHYMFRPQRAIIRWIYQICYIAIILFIYYRYYVVFHQFDIDLVLLGVVRNYRPIISLPVNKARLMSLPVTCRRFGKWVNDNMNCGQDVKWTSRKLWRWISMLRVAPAASSHCCGMSWIFWDVSIKNWIRGSHAVASEYFPPRY